MSERKILCLHGWGGSADDFELAKLSQLRGKRVSLKAPFAVPLPEFNAFLRKLGVQEELIDMLADFDHWLVRVCVCALQLLSYPPSHTSLSPPAHTPRTHKLPHSSWLDPEAAQRVARATASADNRCVRVPLVRWRAALDALAAEWTRSGPFDAVAGFSQGAMLALLLLAAARAEPTRYACFRSIAALVLIGIRRRPWVRVVVVCICCSVFAMKLILVFCRSMLRLRPSARQTMTATTTRMSLW